MAKQVRVFLANLGFSSFLFPNTTPPLGVMYLAAYLRSKLNVDLKIINQKLDNCSNNRLIRQIVDFMPDIVGLSAMTPYGLNQTYVSREVKRLIPKALIVLGGPHVSSFRTRALEGTNADVAVPGEGELAFEGIIRRHLEGNTPEDIPGVLWRNRKGEIISNKGTVSMIKDLDSLPFPAYDLIDLPSYWRCQSMTSIPRRKYISLISSRGCPYQCEWCHNIFGKIFRPHSSARLYEELQYFQKKYGVNDVEFIDDIFNLNQKRVLGFCELIKRNSLHTKICFPTGLRGDILTEEVIESLVEAGMYLCCLALESGSPRIQKLMRKNLDISRFLNNVEFTSRAGVFTCGYFMIGFPTETEEEMEQTINVACNSHLHTASFFTVTPFPNTPLYENLLLNHPEKLQTINYENMNFNKIMINLSAVHDKKFFYYQRLASHRFYFNAKRIFRIFRDFPQPHLLPMYLPQLLKRLTKGIFSRPGPSNTRKQDAFLRKQW